MIAEPQVAVKPKNDWLIVHDPPAEP
jgi:hypothetical protein